MSYDMKKVPVKAVTGRRRKKTQTKYFQVVEPKLHIAIVKNNTDEQVKKVCEVLTQNGCVVKDVIRPHKHYLERGKVCFILYKKSTVIRPNPPNNPAPFPDTTPTGGEKPTKGSKGKNRRGEK